MRVALVPPCDRRHGGGLDRQTRELARAVVRRGGEVEVLQPSREARLPAVEMDEGTVIRRLPLSGSHLPFSMARAVSRHLPGARYDIVHAQTQEALLAVGVSRDWARRVLFTPNASLRGLLHGTYGSATGWVLGRSAGVVCRADAEADLVERLLPVLRFRVAVVPGSVDAAAIRAATPIGASGDVVLSVGPLAGHRELASTVAALPALDDGFHLVAIGVGPARRSLEAFAADLQVRSRVHFLARPPPPERYGWLRTARVLVAPSADPGFPLALLEAVATGTPVVASDISIHREVASYAGHAGVRLIPLESSPLAVADAIAAAATTTPAVPALDAIPSPTETAERTVDVYEAVVAGRPLVRASASERRRGQWATPAVGGRADVDLPGVA